MTYYNEHAVVPGLLLLWPQKKKPTENYYSDDDDDDDGWSFFLVHNMHDMQDFVC
jgi:hypothetical protein